MRVFAILGVAMSLACGCARGAGGPADDDPGAGEVQEPVSGFTGPFSFRTRRVGEHTFSVPDKGTVTVTARAAWDRPAACKLSTYTISLVEGGLFGATSTRTYPTSGVPHTETWKALGAGVYHLVFETVNDNPSCVLAGTVTVAVTVTP